MASYTGYIPAVDASDYDTKISDFITDVETDMSSAQSSIIILTAVASSNASALSGAQDFDFNDGKGIILGDHNDTTIQHINGTGTEIRNDGTDGPLFLYSGSTSIELDSSKITTNADIYIEGSTSPKIVLIPNSSGGYISYNMYDTSSGISRGSFAYNDANGVVSLARTNSSGVQETKLILNDNKTVSVYGSSSGDPGADPVNASDLCNKSYTDGRTLGGYVLSSGTFYDGSPGLSSISTGAGRYKITHNLGTTDYTANAIVVDYPYTNNFSIIVYEKTSSYITFSIYNSGVSTYMAFNFSIIKW